MSTTRFRPNYERAHAPVLASMRRRLHDADLDGHLLSPDRVADFERDGFVAPIPVFDAVDVAQFTSRLETLRTELHRWEDRLYEIETASVNRPDEVPLHFLGGWRVDPWFHDLLFLPEITVPCAQLLGVDRLRFFHDQVFYKPARHGGVVPWHQDYSYWTRTGPPCHITINIMLDGAAAENGGLQFVPGSHRWKLRPPVDFGGPMDVLFEDRSDDARLRPTPVLPELRPGEASIHHSHTVHGSGANRTDRPRRAVVLNFMSATTRCIDDTAPLLRGVPSIAKGDVVQGDFFPVVFDRST